MILADTRHRLTRDDAQLAARLLAQEIGEDVDRVQARLVDEGIDAILDDPRLPRALLRNPRGAYASFALFAYVMIRHALRRAGVEDRGVADYVTSIVVHFGKHGRAQRISDGDDEMYEALFELADDLQDRDFRRSFLVRTHLGNYALWLSGIFPDYVEARRWRKGGPDLEYYEEMGRRGFELAADHKLAEQYGLAPLFWSVAERFPLLRVALNDVSDSLFFPTVQTPDRLMRQVADETRWKLGR